MLLELREQAEIVIVINSDAIEKNKRRGDIGITYDLDVLRLIDAFREIGLHVGSVVLTHYRSQHLAQVFEKKLKTLGIEVYRHYPIPEYPYNVPLIVSDEGYGRNDYIETQRSLVVVTAPGPGSGKMATCLSQLYHEQKRGKKAGYAKFETFPIWNLPLKHPINLAYEAATADLDDLSIIDPYHFEAYGVTTINYNRDIEIFPVLEAIFKKIFDYCPYRSPTDMGVNMAGYAIIDDGVCREAAKQEIVRRFYSSRCALRQGIAEPSEVYRLEMLMKSIGITQDIRKTVRAALEVAERTSEPAVAVELPDGRLVTGKTSPLLGASSAALLNALKTLGEIDDGIELISPEVIEPIQQLKVEHMGNHNPRLHTDEVLIALSICAVTDRNAAHAIAQLSRLKGSEAHSTVILSRVDESVFQKLGVNLTCEPKYQTKKLYHK